MFLDPLKKGFMTSFRKSEKVPRLFELAPRPVTEINKHHYIKSVQDGSEKVVGQKKFQLISRFYLRNV
jgi:hypothetical protein